MLLVTSPDLFRDRVLLLNFTICIELIAFRVAKGIVEPWALKLWWPRNTSFLSFMQNQMYYVTTVVRLQYSKLLHFTHFDFYRSSKVHIWFRRTVTGLLSGTDIQNSVDFFEGWRTFFDRRRNGLPRWFYGKVSQNLSMWQSRGNVSEFSVGDMIKHKKIGKKWTWLIKLH